MGIAVKKDLRWGQGLSLPMTGIDPRMPRLNQGLVGAAALVAFLADAPLIVPFLALPLLAGALLGPQRNPVALLWRRVIVPGLRLSAPARTKDAAPVRFAQAVGAGFLLAASLAFLAAVPLVGWGLTLLVATLALLAAVTDICVGCEAYVLLRKWSAGAASG